MRLPRLVVLTAATALVVAGIAAPTVAHAATPRALTLPSATSSFARTAALVGSTDPSERVDFAVSVAGKDDAGLGSLAQAVSYPASPQFRHFLTKAQRTARFTDYAVECRVRRATPSRIRGGWRPTSASWVTPRRACWSARPRP